MVIDFQNELTVSDRLHQAVAAGVITDAHADAIALAFDEHANGGCSVHLERLVHDERVALDRVCAWLETHR